MLEYFALIFYILGTATIGFILFKEYSEKNNELFRLLDEEFKKGWSFISILISILFGIILWFFLKPWGYFIGFTIGLLISYYSVNKIVPNLGKEAKPVDLLTYWASKYQFKRKIVKPKPKKSNQETITFEEIKIKTPPKKEEVTKKVVIEKPSKEEKKEEHGLWRKYQEKYEEKHEPLWKEKYKKEEEEKAERRKIVEDLVKQLKSMKKEEKAKRIKKEVPPKKEEKPKEEEYDILSILESSEEEESSEDLEKLLKELEES
jgi:hypothetical protein